MILERIRTKGHFGFFILDFLMILLLVINLNWIVFDWLFVYEPIRNFWSSVAPEFTEMYARVIHPRFILIDLMFVSVFLTEFFVRWFIAVYNRVYHRWFFFPFIHFYDLLGCIPVGGFRFLRLLRIISITYRLQKIGIIDLSDTLPVAFFRKYYGILIEELSDRVTLNILSDIQQEVRNGGPVVDRVVTEVVLPQKESLVEWMSHRVELVADQNQKRYEEDIQSYVQERINTAVQENKEFARLEQIPLFGSLARSIIEKAISDIVFNVINGIMQDLASNRNRALIDEAADILFDAILLKEEDSNLNLMVTDTLDRSLEIVKQQVMIQQWKIRDLAVDEEDFRRRLREELMKYREQSTEDRIQNTEDREQSSEYRRQNTEDREQSSGSGEQESVGRR